MNLHIINIVIRREYLTRVKKKSFLVTTFLVPVLFAALCILPALIINGAKEEARKVAVSDASGIVMPWLGNSKAVEFIDYTGVPVDSLKSGMKRLGVDAVLSISELDEENRTVTSDIVSVKPLGIELTESINGRISDAVEAYRIGTYDIAGLDEIMKDVKANVRVKSYTLDESGEEKVSEATVYMLVSILLGLVIYMFVTLFGAMVMSSVIEEKASRVVEVLVSSVKAVELMFGKIIGVALVAFTQFFLWIALTLVIVGVVGGVAGKKIVENTDPSELIQSMGGAGVHPVDADAIAASMSETGQFDVILDTLRNLPLGLILVCFALYFLFGYMLYASLFAAIGSAVENEGDSQQLQIPLTIPLMLGLFISLYAFKAPDSAVAFWGSMIPFTSPIVMLARLPFGVAAWEIIVSIVVLILSFAACAWISAKIYKVGILMFGKKSTWKDLWNWFRQK